MGILLLTSCTVIFKKKTKSQQIIKDGDNALCAKMINYTQSIAKKVLGDILNKSKQ